MIHFELDKSPKTRENRELLMTILEPLLGEGIDYSAFMTGVNNYSQSAWYREAGLSRENTRRFLENVMKGWRKRPGKD